MEPDIKQTDVLVVGGGAAGITAAIEAHDHGARVTLANKGAICRDGAAVWMAGWGFQAALYPPDSIEQHVEDTIRGGHFLNNQELVKTFLSLAPRAMQDLSKWGLRLAKDGDRFLQLRLPGQTHPRNPNHTYLGLMLGTEYRKAFSRQIRRRKEIDVMEDFFLVDLVKNGAEVAGALGIDMARGKLVLIKARSTILATGGYMGCYGFTTANFTLTGDGHAAAYRAGARMTGMEFIQFMPTTTLYPEIVRGDLYPYSLLNGLYALFYNSLGERFMERYYPKERDWATREAASRAIAREVREGRGSPRGGAYLSMTHLPKNLVNDYLERNKESEFLKSLKKVGFDITEQALEVGPAVHYVQGGCWIDEKCQTNLRRLYAIGEVGSGGKDGADRLAGNSLPFCMAMAYVASQEAANSANSSKLPEVDGASLEALIRRASSPLKRKGGAAPEETKTTVRETLQRYALFQRAAEDLETGLREIGRARDEMLPKLGTRDGSRRFNLDWTGALEAENMVCVAEMVLQSALTREESRGLHERADFPDEDSKWLKHIIIEKTNEEMSFSFEPVTFPYVRPTEK